MPRAEELFAHHHRDVFRYLAHMTGSADEAEDLAQEVFVRVVRAIENGGAIGHERGWVFSIARNLIVDRIRAAQRSPFDAADCEPAMRGTQDVAFDLCQALARLPVADREMFLLKEVGGLTYLEIADTCQCTVEGVRSRLYRARIALRALLNPRAGGSQNGFNHGLRK